MKRRGSGTTPAVVAQAIATPVDLGADELFVHHVGKGQRPFIDAFGEHVLPELRHQ